MNRFYILLLVLSATAVPTGNALADARSDAAAFCSDFTVETGVKCDVQRCPCGRTTTEKARFDRGGVRISVCACVSKSGLEAYENADRSECRTDSDCNDGVFCNGTEVCSAGQCVPGALPCGPGLCVEDSNTCRVPCEDKDGDGYDAIHCGGDDCDDSNPDRAPGNREICDPQGIDEDCDPRTVGSLDADGDGYISAECM